jgi:hypothetical protein
MKWSIIYLGLGIIFTICAGISLAEGIKNKKGYFILFLFCFICGTIFNYLGLDSYSKIPNGLPFKLTKERNYQVQIVKEFSDEGQKWIGVLILKEEGKTDPKVPPYGKVLASFFKKEQIVYGLPITIESRTLPSRHVIIVKEDP